MWTLIQVFTNPIFISIIINSKMSSYFSSDITVCWKKWIIFFIVHPQTLHKKWSFTLRISSVNVTKSHLLNKYLMENFIFCAMAVTDPNHYCKFLSRWKKYSLPWFLLMTSIWTISLDGPQLPAIIMMLHLS